MRSGASTGDRGPRSTVHGPRPLVIGHRGFPARFPDNSLAGVRAALGAGADGVEVDVRPTSDGVWVCHHDRVRGGRPIGEWSLAALWRAGVPALEEVVAAVPDDRWLFVEVKPLPQAVARALLPALGEALAGRASLTRLISSSELVLGEAEFTAGFLPRSFVFGELPEWLPNGVELSPRHTLVEAVLATGRALHPWTVNRAARMRELARLGVASITTNAVDLAVEVLRG